MRYKGKLFFLCISLMPILILLSGCSKSGKSEKAIAQDLQNNSFFQDNMDVEITEYSIIKRQTNVENKSDIVYINTDAKNDDFRWNRSYIMTYGLYNEGWILDDVTEYNFTEWKIWPLHGITEESLTDYIEYNKSEYDFDSAEVLDRETFLDENAGTDIVTFKIVKEHLLGTETLDIQQTWYYNTNYCAWETLSVPQQLDRTIILNNSMVGTEWKDLARYDGTYNIFCDAISFKVDTLNDDGIIMSVTRKDIWAAHWNGLNEPPEFTAQIACSYLTCFDDGQIGFSLSALDGMLYNSQDDDNFDDNDYFIFDLDNSASGKILSMGELQIEAAIEKNVISGKSIEDEALEYIVSIAQENGVPCCDPDNPILGVWNWESDNSYYYNHTVWLVCPDGTLGIFREAYVDEPDPKAVLMNTSHWSYDENYFSIFYTETLEQATSPEKAEIAWAGCDRFELVIEDENFCAYANRVKYDVNDKDAELNSMEDSSIVVNLPAESNTPKNNADKLLINEYRDILPTADGFTQLDITLPEMYENGSKNFVTEIYLANNTTGYVFVVVGDGFAGKGTMKLIVSMDMSGNIVESRTLEQSETAGLGSKVTKDDFRNQFIGVNADTLNDSVDCITGATISSNCYINSIRSTFNAYEFVMKNQ